MYSVKLLGKYRLVSLRNSRWPTALRLSFKTICSAVLAITLTACASSGGVTATDKTASSDTTSSGSFQATGNDYQISPEDVLDISVWKEPELQQTVTVRPDGGISFPLVGNILAAGRTPAELQSDIKIKLDEYIPDAVVNVSVKQIQGLRIFVSGKVRQPGQFTVGRYVDVLQALTLAGGITAFADGKNIRVLRRNGTQETIYHFDYNRVQRGESMEQNIVLRSGDTVIVP